MAGTARSGRRKMKGIDPTVNLPDVEGTRESVTAYLCAAVNGAGQNKIDPRYLDALVSGCKAIYAGIRDGEIDALEKMLDEVKTLEREGMAKETADRLHLDD